MEKVVKPLLLILIKSIFTLIINVLFVYSTRKHLSYRIFLKVPLIPAKLAATEKFLETLNKVPEFHPPSTEHFFLVVLPELLKRRKKNNVFINWRKI